MIMNQTCPGFCNEIVLMTQNTLQQQDKLRRILDLHDKRFCVGGSPGGKKTEKTSRSILSSKVV